VEAPGVEPDGNPAFPRTLAHSQAQRASSGACVGPENTRTSEIVPSAVTRVTTAQLRDAIEVLRALDPPTPGDRAAVERVVALLGGAK